MPFKLNKHLTVQKSYFVNMANLHRAAKTTLSRMPFGKYFEASGTP